MNLRVGAEPRSRFSKGAERLAAWSFALVHVDLLASLCLGLLAACFGGALTALGSGVGGAWGMPDLALFLASLLALPSFIVGLTDLVRKRPGAFRRTLAYVFLVLITLGYILIAHSLDPCSTGLWDSFSRVGSVLLCERFGPELNVHTRFHLLWHVLPTLPLLVLYRLTHRRRA